MTWRSDIEVVSVLVEGATGPSTYDVDEDAWIDGIEKTRGGFIVKSNDGKRDSFLPLHRVYEADIIDHSGDRE